MLKTNNPMINRKPALITVVPVIIAIICVATLVITMRGRAQSQIMNSEAIELIRTYLPIIMRSYQPGVVNPDLEIIKSDHGVTGLPGDVITYTLTYSNVGDAIATGILLTDTIPNYSSFDPVHSSSGWQQIGAGDLYSYSVASLDPGVSEMLLFAVSIDDPLPPGIHSITNTVTIQDDGSHGMDPTPANNNASDFTPVINLPDLVIDKSDQGITIHPGDLITYTIAYSNTGNQASTGVAITETVPDNTTYDPASSSPGWEQIGASEAYTYNVGSLNVGDMSEVTFGVIVDEALPPLVETITNTVSIGDDYANGNDRNPANNTFTLLTPVFLGPDFSMSIEPDIHYVVPDQSVVYTTTLTAIEGFNDPIWLSVSGLPAGATESWSANPITPTANSILTISTALDTPLRSYPLTVTGSGGDRSHDIQAMLILEPETLPVIDHCGTISINESWEAGYVHRITCNITVNSGVTISLSPHAIVKFMSNLRLNNYGTLVAEGTEANPIVFTSYKDDSYGGDTNGDGGTSTPHIGDWGGISVAGNGQASFNHVIVQYGYGAASLSDGLGTQYGVIAGTSSSSGDDTGVNISITNSLITKNNGGVIIIDNRSTVPSAISISSSIFRDNINNGAAIFGAENISIENCSFANNGTFGVRSGQYNSFTTITNNVFTSNGSYGIYVGTSITSTITNNSISDSSTAIYIAGADITLTGNTFANSTTDVGWIKINDGNLTMHDNLTNGQARLLWLEGIVHNSLTLGTDIRYFGVSSQRLFISGPENILTIEPGVVIKATNNSILSTDGTLIAEGTEANPIVFTSYKDDSYGGDTNGDGGASTPQIGDWRGIGVTGNGQASFNHVVVQYGYGAASWSDGWTQYGVIAGTSSSSGDDTGVNISITNSLITKNNGGVIIIDNRNTVPSAISISNSSFLDNINNGVAIFGAENISIDNCSFTNNGTFGVRTGNYNSFTTITNNVFTNNGSYGIYVGTSVTSSITNNSISDSSTAIYIAGADITLTGNTFANSTTDVGWIKINDGNLTMHDNLTNGQARLLWLEGTVHNSLTLGTDIRYFGVSSQRLFISGPENILTIEPGVVIKATNNSILSTDGTLIAEGTEANPIVFTSYKDDSYGGDTNGDGGASTPYIGDWRGILITGNGQAAFNYIIARYGYGAASVSSNFTHYGVIAGATSSDGDDTGVNISITNSLIEKNNGGVILFDFRNTIPSNISISNSIIRDNVNNGITLYFVGSNGLATNNRIYNNGTFGIYNATGTPILGLMNYWGADDGPAPYGSGDPINTTQIWDPVCQCNITKPAVFFSPWLDSSGQIVGPSPAQTIGSPSSSTTKFVADPVNVVFGNYTYQYTDLAFPTLGDDFVFQRTYNSASTDASPLGIGWTHTYNVAALTSSNTVIVQREDGRKDLYTDAGGGNYLSPPGVYDTLRFVTDHYVLTRKDQAIYTFNPDCTLASLADHNGNTTTFTYSGGNLVSLTEPTGRQVLFSYSGSLLTQISDSLGRTVSFGYNGGHLTSVTDVNGHSTAYTYDLSGRLNSITDANGHTFVQNVYDTGGRVVEQRDALNNLTTFSYDPNTRINAVTDPRNFTTHYQYDSAYRLVSETDPLGYTQTYGFDANNNQTSATDKRGNTTTFTYDNRGNVITITAPIGVTKSFTYDDHNNLLTEIDPLNHTTTNTYDSHGNRLTASDALSHTTTYTYYSDANRMGRLANITDPRGAVTTYDYNAQGDLTQVTDALSGIVTSTYDLGGRQLTRTDARSHTWTYTYDDANRLLTETDPLSGITTRTYDPVGNLASITDALGRTTTNAYNVKDQLISTIDPAGYTTTYTYDSVGNQTSIQDGNLHTTNYTYDEINRLVNTVDPLGRTTTYGYDANGNRTSLTDALGHTTTYAFDALNRQTGITDPLIHTTTTAYDPVGNVLSVTDPNGHATSYTYNSVNQLFTVTDALSGVVTYAYDANGNRTGLTDANGHTTTFVYDALNRLSSTTDPLGHVTSHTYDANSNRLTTTDANGSTTTYTYDELNRLATITYAGGSTVSYVYNAVSNRTFMTDPTGMTTYVYDGLNRPTSITSPEGTVGYSYDAKNRLSVTTVAGTVTSAYDAADRLSSVTDFAAQVTSYSYDNANRQIGITYPNGVSATYAYDNANHLTGITYTKSVTLEAFAYTLDAAGNRLTMTDADGVTSYSYDALNRLTGVTYPSGTPASVSYTYDSMGNRLTMLQDGLTTSYTYDAADCLLSTITDGVTTPFTWDNNGILLTKGTQTFSWDHANRLAGLTNGGTTANYTYNGDGVRVGRTVNGVTTTYLQDLATGLPVVLREITIGVPTDYVYGNDLLTSIDNTGTPLFYHADGLGSTRLLSDISGAVTDHYSYDAFGVVRFHSGSSIQPFTFSGEQLDYESQFLFLRARYYIQEEGIFISHDSFKGFINQPLTLNSYIYAGQNPINNIDPSGMTFGVISAWNDFLYNTKQIEPRLRMHYEGDFDNPQWYENEQKLQNDIKIWLGSASYAAVSVPGTSANPSLPPTNRKDLVSDVIKDWLKKIMNQLVPGLSLEYERPSVNRLSPYNYSTQRNVHNPSQLEMSWWGQPPSKYK